MKGWPPDRSGIVERAERKRGNGFTTKKGLIAWAEETTINPRERLKTQPDRIGSGWKIVNKNVSAQIAAQCGDVLMPGDDDSGGKDTLRRGERMTDQRHAAKIGHQLVAAEAFPFAGGHDHASARAEWRIQIDYENILPCEQLIQKGERLFAHDGSHPLFLHHFANRFCILFTAGFKIADLVNCDPFAV